jgi:hypothetical protein
MRFHNNHPMADKQRPMEKTEAVTKVTIRDFYDGKRISLLVIQFSDQNDY